MGLSRTSWAVSLAAACLTVLRDYSVTLRSISYPYPDGAMNKATADFMASGCDEMIVIDTDVVFEPRHLAWLLEHDVPLVAGLYPKKQIGLEFPCEILDDVTFSQNPHEEPLIPVKRVARGFMRFRRVVFEMLSPTTETYTDAQTGEQCFDFWRKLAGGHSEDFYFCDKWREAGGAVYVDQRICAQHEGTALYPIPGTF